MFQNCLNNSNENRNAGFKNLIHGHSIMQNIKNNNIGNSKLKNRPETVRNGSFERPPPTATIKAILTLNLPATHYVTQPNPANNTDDESKNKKSNIPPPPGGNVKTRTNIWDLNT